MVEFVWPVTLITMSVIWAAAWVTVERFKYPVIDDEVINVEEDEDDRA